MSVINEKRARAFRPRNTHTHAHTRPSANHTHSTRSNAKQQQRPKNQTHRSIARADLRPDGATMRPPSRTTAASSLESGPSPSAAKRSKTCPRRRGRSTPGAARTAPTVRPATRRPARRSCTRWRGCAPTPTPVAPCLRRSSRASAARRRRRAAARRAWTRPTPTMGCPRTTATAASAAACPFTRAATGVWCFVCILRASPPAVQAKNNTFPTRTRHAHTHTHTRNNNKTNKAATTRRSTRAGSPPPTPTPRAPICRATRSRSARSAA